MDYIKDFEDKTDPNGEVAKILKFIEEKKAKGEKITDEEIWDEFFEYAKEWDGPGTAYQ